MIGLNFNNLKIDDTIFATNSNEIQKFKITYIRNMCSGKIPPTIELHIVNEKGENYIINNCYIVFNSFEECLNYNISISKSRWIKIYGSKYPEWFI